MDIPKFVPQGFKIFKGAFGFHKGSTMYSEESFEVFRDRKDLSLHYKGSITSRVSTGELLTIDVDYFVTKDFIPIRVLTERRLGPEHIAEYIQYDKKKDVLTYEFIENVGTTQRQIKTPPRFFIATPIAATSTIFLRTKKFDSAGLNTFNIWRSSNQWNFETEPELTIVHARQMSTATENIMIDGHNVQALHYHVLDHAENTELDLEQANVPFLNVYQSKFGGIPYIIRSDEEGLKIQIKYLNNLDDHT